MERRRQPSLHSLCSSVRGSSWWVAASLSSLQFPSRQPYLPSRLLPSRTTRGRQAVRQSSPPSLPSPPHIAAMTGPRTLRSINMVHIVPSATHDPVDPLTCSLPSLSLTLPLYYGSQPLFITSLRLAAPLGILSGAVSVQYDPDNDVPTRMHVVGWPGYVREFTIRGVTLNTHTFHLTHIRNFFDYYSNITISLNVK